MVGDTPENLSDKQEAETHPHVPRHAIQQGRGEDTQKIPHHTNGYAVESRLPQFRRTPQLLPALVLLEWSGVVSCGQYGAHRVDHELISSCACTEPPQPPWAAGRRRIG